MTKRRLLTLGAAAAIAAGALATSAFALQGGTPDGNQHPYVGAAIWFPTGDPADGFGLCSGTLVSATVFITAAHCFPSGATVFVDMQEGALADLHQPGFGSAVSGVVVDDPDFQPRPGGLSHSDLNDVAVVVLSGDGLPGPYAALPLRVGYDDSLPNNQSIENVGYGLPDAGVRQVVTEKIIPGGGATGANFLKISGGDTCFGDSGGPNLVGDTVVAINSYGASASCNAVSYSQRLDTPEVYGFVTGGYMQFLN
jgi:hypothetical protein